MNIHTVNIYSLPYIPREDNKFSGSNNVSYFAKPSKIYQNKSKSKKNILNIMKEVD